MVIYCSRVVLSDIFVHITTIILHVRFVYILSSLLPII